MPSYPSTIYVHTDRDAIFTQDRKNAFGEEIGAIQTELGLNPRTSVLYGARPSVADRLGLIDTILQAGLDVGAQGLRITMNAVSPLTTVDVTADVLNVQGFGLAAVSVSAALTVSGLNGLDTGAEAANTWYSVWVGYSPVSGTRAALLSTSATRAGLTLTHASLVNYTAWRRVGWVRNNASSNLVPMIQQQARVRYETEVDVTQVLAGGNATAFTAISTSSMQAVVPPNVRLAELDVALRVTGNTSVSAASDAEARFRPGGSTLANGNVRAARSRVVTGTFQQQAAHEQATVSLGSGRELDYRIIVATGGTGTEYVLDVAVLGYTDPGI